MDGFHHLRGRARLPSRLGEHLEPFPAESFFKKNLDYLMYGVGILAPFALLPQIIQIYSTQSASGLSLVTWSLLVTFNLLWATYGFAHKEAHILLANAFMALFNLTIVIGILMY